MQTVRSKVGLLYDCCIYNNYNSMFNFSNKRLALKLISLTKLYI